MLYSFSIIFYLSVALILFAFSEHKQQTTDYHVVTTNETEFFLVSPRLGEARAIQDLLSAHNLGFDDSSIRKVSLEYIHKYKITSTIPLVHLRDGSPDEVTRVALLKMSILEGTDLIEEFEYIGEYINPGVMKWNGRLLLCSGQTWSVGGRAAAGELVFSWLNHSSAPFYSADVFLGIGTVPTELDRRILGQDVRILVLSDKDIAVAYTYMWWSRVRMGLAYISVNASGFAVTTNVYDVIQPDQDPKMDHKNWSPFIYNSSILMIQSINPLHVVVPVPAGGNVMSGNTVSLVPEVHLHWEYGHLRGGTNAVLIGDRYLSFFHAASHLPGNGKKTYFMGAYTFSADPPFELLALSAYPIMPEKFYTGEWAPFKNRNNDYVVFPMNFFIEDFIIHMSIGVQDHQGFLLKMKLMPLLDSLRPVHEIVE